MRTIQFTEARLISMIFLLTLVLSIFLNACSPGAQTDTVDDSKTNPIQSRADLIAALQASGAEVSESGEIKQEFFSPTGQVLDVNQADIQVFEYPDEALRESESDLISENGSSIGTTMITWIDQPNFWVNGRVIVLYIGTDLEMIGLLESVLGSPLTSHP